MKNKSRWDSLSIKDRATLINMYAKGGYTNIDDMRNHYNSFGEGGPEEEYTVPTREEYKKEKISNMPLWQKIINSAKETDYRDTGVGAVMNNYMTNLYLEGKEQEAKEFANRVGHATMSGLALGAGLMSPTIAGSQLLGDIAITSGTTLGDTLLDWEKYDWGNSKIEDVKQVGKDLLTNIGFDVLGHGVNKFIEKGVDLYKAKKGINLQTPSPSSPSPQANTASTTANAQTTANTGNTVNVPSQITRSSRIARPGEVFRTNGTDMNMEDYEDMLRNMGISEAIISKLINRVRFYNMTSTEVPLYASTLTNTGKLDPFYFRASDFNVPNIGKPETTVTDDLGTTLSRGRYEDSLKRLGYNDTAIRLQLDKFDDRVVNDYFREDKFPGALEYFIDVSPTRYYDASADFVRNNFDNYKEEMLKRLGSLTEVRDVNSRYPEEHWTFNYLAPEYREVLAEKYPQLAEYFVNGKAPDDNIRKLLYDELGLETPLGIHDMYWNFGGSNNANIFGAYPDINIAGQRYAVRSSNDFFDQMPRYSVFGVDNTSKDSELIKLRMAAKNYGTGPNQKTVEIIPNGNQYGNAMHLEGIYLEEVLNYINKKNPGGLPNSEVELIKNYIESRRRGGSDRIDYNLIPEFRKQLKDYYNYYTDRYMIAPLKKYWEEIIQKDPRYIGIEMPSVPDYSSSIERYILDRGKFNPKVKRAPIAVVTHANGGKLNKYEDGGQTKNFVEKREFPTYSSWEENVAANWPVAPKPTIDYEEIKRRQRWAESQDNPDVKSRAGAKGLFQIMPSTHKEYVAKTGKKGNIYDPKYNTEIRDWYMQDMLNSRTITNGNPTDSVQLAKQLAAYNWGRGNLGSFLEKQKKAGVDIYNTLDWIDAMPKEPRDYVNFILRNKDTGGPRNNELYNNRSKIFLEY